jgi:hypothetical protein
MTWAAENCIMRNFIICSVYQTLLQRSDREGQICGTRSTHGNKEILKNILFSKTEGKRVIGIYLKIILRSSKRIKCEGVEWIHLAQDHDGEPLGFVKEGMFLNQLSDCQLLNEDCVLLSR